MSSGEEVNEALDYYFTTEEYGIWVDVFGEKVGMVLQGDGSDSFFFCEDRELSKLGYGGTFLYEDFRDPDPDVIP